jgi:hypothetical protein
MAWNISCTGRAHWLDWQLHSLAVNVLVLPLWNKQNIFLEHWHLQCCYWKLITLNSWLFSCRNSGTGIGSGGIRSSSSSVSGCCSSAASHHLFVSFSSFVCWSLYMSATKYVPPTIVCVFYSIQFKSIFIHPAWSKHWHRIRLLNTWLTSYQCYHTIQVQFIKHNTNTIHRTHLIKYTLLIYMTYIHLLSKMYIVIGRTSALFWMS